MNSGIFAEWAEPYRQKGFWPRPIQPGTKACKLPGWQKPDPEIDRGTLSAWTQRYGDCGIGLLLGSPLPDGTILGGLDIDHDAYVRVVEVLLSHPPCGRVGARGALYFVRIQGDGRYREFKVKGDGATTKVGELLVTNRLAVIPPTIHPDTNQPYRWIGTPLHELDLAALPVLEMPR